MIRQVIESDASKICSIYNEYIINTTISFEEIPIGSNEIISRINEISKYYPWIVYEDKGNVIGYAYAAKWKERSAYRHSVEAAIYIDSKHLGKGVGTRLLDELLKELKHRSIHCVIAGIALPNPASIALFEKFGFVNIACFREVGYKFNRWIDVGYWELLL